MPFYSILDTVRPRKESLPPNRATSFVNTRLILRRMRLSPSLFKFAKSERCENCTFGRIGVIKFG